MGKTYRRGAGSHHGEDDLIIRSKRRAEPDLRKLARALIAIAEAETAAEAAHLSGETEDIRQREAFAGSTPSPTDLAAGALDEDCT